MISWSQANPTSNPKDPSTRLLIRRVEVPIDKHHRRHDNPTLPEPSLVVGMTIATRHLIQVMGQRLLQNGCRVLSRWLLALALAILVFHLVSRLHFHRLGVDDKMTLKDKDWLDCTGASYSSRYISLGAETTLVIVLLSAHVLRDGVQCLERMWSRVQSLRKVPILRVRPAPIWIWLVFGAVALILFKEFVTGLLLWHFLNSDKIIGIWNTGSAEISRAGMAQLVNDSIIKAVAFMLGWRCLEWTWAAFVLIVMSISRTSSSSQRRRLPLLKDCWKSVAGKDIFGTLVLPALVFALISAHSMIVFDGYCRQEA